MRLSSANKSASTITANCDPNKSKENRAGSQQKTVNTNGGG